MSPQALTIETRCPFSDCLAVFLLPLSTQDPKASRPVAGVCPTCNRRASFKPLSILLKLSRQVGHHSVMQPVGEPVHGCASSNSQYPFALSVLVEDVRSLWNVGSIFRSADGAGFGQLFLSGITGCPPRKEIAKTSLGAEDHLVWSYFLSAVDVIPELKKAGVLIVGLERNQQSIDLEQTLSTDKLQTPLCLIVGNEVTGLSVESLDLCDVVCHLPMRGFKESLNVAVAFGVAAYLLSSKLLPHDAESSNQNTNSTVRKSGDFECGAH
ncbi:MAG: TrmH family RNA methyltransferase [Candidatus Obscuribacterales bacterium]